MAMYKGLLLALVALAAAALALTAAIPAWAASGTWERAWGTDVIQSGAPGDTGTGFEICTVAANCKRGQSGGTFGGELNGLHATAVDAAGNVYVSNDGDGRLEKFDGAGDFEAAWGIDVVNGGGTGFEICTVAADCKSSGPNDGTGGAFTSPNGVAATGSDVWVGDSQFARIQKFDSAGNFELAIGKDVIKSGAPGDTGTGFEICTVASDCFGNQTGSLGGEFRGSSIATDSAGNLYVADSGNNRIQKFDSSGHFLSAWGINVDSVNPSTGYEICTAVANCQTGAPGSFGGTLSDPQGIATDPATGNVYVGDVGEARIDEFSSSGTWLRAWGFDVIQSGKPGDTGTGFEICTVLADCKTAVQGSAGGQMAGPYGVAVGASNRVYEADLINDRIQVFDTSGNFIAAWGANVDATTPGTGYEICPATDTCQKATDGGVADQTGGELWGPQGMSVGCGDALYVADATQFRVDRFGDAPPPSTCGGSSGGGSGGGGGTSGGGDTGTGGGTLVGGSGTAVGGGGGVTSSGGTTTQPPSGNPLGLPAVHGCLDTRKFKFKLHRPPGVRIVRVDVFINGKRKLHLTGHDIRSVTVKRLPKKKFVLKVVATQSSGSQLISTRTYKGCKKFKPHTRAHHHR